MNLLYSNGPLKDFVIAPFQRMIHHSKRLRVAAPYVTFVDDLVEAVHIGKPLDLLIGLNEITCPNALRKLHNLPNCSIRYYTRRFHAKIYLFDEEALLGSSNLTRQGMEINREATMIISDQAQFDEIRSLFSELWESASVLTIEKLNEFAAAKSKMPPPFLDGNPLIEKVVGKSEPTNIAVDSHKKTKTHVFLEDIRRLVYEQYRPAFTEVTRIIDENNFRRLELQAFDSSTETNRFLNWVRQTYVIGDEAWRNAPLRSVETRKSEILALGREWTHTENNKIPVDYLDWLQNVRNTFQTRDTIENASKEILSSGLMCIHAFNEQYRFVSGGVSNVAETFWNANGQNIDKAKKTLIYLVHGSGDFIERLHEVLYNPSFKLAYFGIFCALELYGTMKPNECPPMNGRMAKALRYLGFDVRGG